MIVLRNLTQDTLHLLHIYKVHGNLQIRRVPEPLNFESHNCVGCSVLLLQDGCSVRELIKRTGECKAGCSVVEAVQLVEVLCLRRDENTCNNDHIIHIHTGKDAVFQCIGNCFGDCGLCRAEDLGYLFGVLQRNLRNDQNCRFWQKVRPDNTKQRSMSGGELGQAVCKSGSDRPHLVADHKIDVSEFCSIANECFTNQKHRKSLL